MKTNKETTHMDIEASRSGHPAQTIQHSTEFVHTIPTIPTERGVLKDTIGSVWNNT
jgi:hypothetical protein